MPQEKPNWEKLPPRDWGEEQAHRTALEVRRLRGKRTAQWLAERTKELGYPLTRAVISDIEVGRRRYVTTAELIVLAAALNTSPVCLVYPGPYDTVVEVIPNSEDRPEYAAAEWFSGANTYIRGDELFEDRTDEWDEWQKNTETLQLWRELNELIGTRDEMDNPNHIAALNRQIKTVNDRLLHLLGREVGRGVEEPPSDIKLPGESDGG